MVETRYTFEFKKFKSGRREGKEYVNVRSTKTGKLIKRVSTTKALKTAHKSHRQQTYRGKKLESWQKVQKKVEIQGGSRKQYEKAIRDLKEEGITGKKARDKAIMRTGYSTYARFFYQSSASKDVVPYIIGESDPEHDIGIEYDTYQAKLPSDRLTDRQGWFDEVYHHTLKEIEDTDQVLHYGGYEITVKDNETGKTVDYTTKGGTYPLKQGKITRKTRTRSKKNDTRF